MTDEQKPPREPQGVIEGTLAQLLGGSLASTIVLGLASAKIFLAAGFESAFGTLLGVIAYICWHKLRSK